MTGTAEKATTLLRLHTDRKILTLVNVWDVASAHAVAAVEGTTAIATASHAIAATYGYRDGEAIPVDLMLEMVGRIAGGVDLPVTADLEAGYGDPAGTIRRAVGLGRGSAPTSRTRLRPVPEAAAAVAATVAAVEAEGVPDFVLNARTDAFLRAGDQDRREVLKEAIARGRAFLDAGAPVVFVPGLLDDDEIGALVDAFGTGRLSLIGVPGMPSASASSSSASRACHSVPTPSASPSRPCRGWSRPSTRACRPAPGCSPDRRRGSTGITPLSAPVASGASSRAIPAPEVRSCALRDLGVRSRPPPGRPRLRRVAPLRDDPGGAGTSSMVVICPKTSMRQARRRSAEASRGGPRYDGHAHPRHNSETESSGSGTTGTLTKLTHGAEAGKE